MIRCLIVALLIISFKSYGAIIDVRLEIKSGTLNLVSGTPIPYKVFTQQSGFPNNSDLLIWEVGDQINLTVVNADSVLHGFTLDSYVSFPSIAVSDSSYQSFTLNNAGVYRYYDPINSPYNEYLGLAGIVHIKNVGDNVPYFYWDVREHQSDWNDTIIQAFNPDLNFYTPDYFTINGNSNPDINNDPTARVVGANGSEFRIVIVNNGLSIHSMHFHGYHFISIADSKYMTGRNKDTFPIYPKDHLVLSCVPDKGGEYPVHDHNLVAVTGGQVYANGIFTTMLIAP